MTVLCVSPTLAKRLTRKRRALGRRRRPAQRLRPCPIGSRNGQQRRRNPGRRRLRPEFSRRRASCRTVEELLLFDDRDLRLNLSGALTQDAAANLALYVGGTRFRFAEVDVFTAGSNTRRWNSSGLTWAEGQIVPLLIVNENKAPTFRLEDWRR